MSEAAPEPRWHDLVAEGDLSEGQIQGMRVGNHKLCIGRSPQGFFALDDECPHAGGSLSEGMLDNTELICPLHAYAFDISTGHCPDDTSCSILAYEVRVEAGKVQVLL